jgi:hypothetical protein
LSNLPDNPTPLVASKIAQVRDTLLCASGSSGQVEAVREPKKWRSAPCPE